MGVMRAERVASSSKSSFPVTAVLYQICQLTFCFDGAHERCQCVNLFDCKIAEVSRSNLRQNTMHLAGVRHHRHQILPRVIFQQTGTSPCAIDACAGFPPRPIGWCDGNWLWWWACGGRLAPPMSMEQRRWVRRIKRRGR